MIVEMAINNPIGRGLKIIRNLTITNNWLITLNMKRSKTGRIDKWERKNMIKDTKVEGRNSNITNIKKIITQNIKSMQKDMENNIIKGVTIGNTSRKN